MNGATMFQGVKPVSSLVSSMTAPFAYWDFISGSVPAIKSVDSITTFTAGGAPDYATRPGWVTLDGADYFTADTYLDPGLEDLFDIGEGAVLAWYQINVTQGVDTATDRIIEVGTGASSSWALYFARSSTAASGTICTAYPSIAFDGDGAAAGYGASANQFAVATDIVIAHLIDNRTAAKTVYNYANGVQFSTASLAGKGACTFASAPTKRMRFFASAAGSPANIALAAVRRFGIINYGQNLPTNINDVITSLTNSNAVPTRELLLSGA